MVLTHPDTIYGCRPTAEEESETIATTSTTRLGELQGSPFNEEDAAIFQKLITAYHRFFCLFHGSMQKVYDETFDAEAEDPLANF